MAKKAKQIDELELVDFYANNKISVRKLAAKFGINSTRCAEILKAHNSRKYDVQSARHGHHVTGPWNKGRNKSNDETILKACKKQSESRRTHYTKDGYKLIYSDELGRSVKIHDYVWYTNTGHWPDGKQDEQIHHIDGCKDNNSFDNLLLVGVAEHSRIHKEYETVFIRLFREGLIEFSRDDRRILWNNFDQLIEQLLAFRLSTQ